MNLTKNLRYSNVARPNRTFLLSLNKATTVHEKHSALKFFSVSYWDPVHECISYKIHTRLRLTLRRIVLTPRRGKFRYSTHDIVPDCRRNAHLGPLCNHLFKLHFLISATFPVSINIRAT